jgi:hypothetical protein
MLRAGLLGCDGHHKIIVFESRISSERLERIDGDGASGGAQTC